MTFNYDDLAHRYTLNGVFSVNTDSRSVLERLLTANAGKVHYLGGVHFMRTAFAICHPMLEMSHRALTS